MNENTIDINNNAEVIDINKKENAKKLIQSFINKRLLLLENL